MPAGTRADDADRDRATATERCWSHGPSGEVLDTESFAPIAGARYDVATTVASPSGRDVLVTDSGNFQSVLFSFDRDEPSYFPGRALAVDDRLVVTTQNVGTEASITVFDHDGDVGHRRPHAVGAGRHDRRRPVILVTVDGEVHRTRHAVSGTTSSTRHLDGRDRPDPAT